MPDLHLLQLSIERQLEQIEKILGPHYKLTLIANHDGHGGLTDADIVLTMSDRTSIIKAIDKFLPTSLGAAVEKARGGPPSSPTQGWA